MKLSIPYAGLTIFLGYTRVILAAVSLHYMSYHPKYSTVAYVVSALLDAFDGMAARAMGQSSKFGAVLDMVTDRCAGDAAVERALIALPQMRNIMSAVLPHPRVPGIRACLPVPHRS